jgi:hypothetical protein
MSAAPRRRSRIRRPLAATAALATVAAVLTAAAPAGPVVLAAPMLRPVGAGTPHQTGPHGGHVNGVSSNWSGYAATGTTFSSVSASWIQPAATCTSQATWSSFWVGLDGDGSQSVEQTGSEVDCSSGQPQYYSWYEMYPAYPTMYQDPVKPGDHFSASVTGDASGRFTLVLTDRTQGWSHTQHPTVQGAARASAEVVAEAPSSLFGVLPLTDFGRVAFTGANANGRPIGSFTPENLTMAANGRTRATTSALTDGTDFTVDWQAN